MSKDASSDAKSSSRLSHWLLGLALALLFEGAAWVPLVDFSVFPDRFSLIKPDLLLGLANTSLHGIAVAILTYLIVTDVLQRRSQEAVFNKLLKVVEGRKDDEPSASFTRFFEQGAVAEIYRYIFSATLLRKDFIATYRLSPHPDSAWLVKLQVTLDYSVTNATSSPVVFRIETEVANYAAIFRDDGGIRPPALISAAVGGDPIGPPKIRRINANIDEAQTPVKFFIAERTIQPNKTLSVCINYERDKLICDSELMRMQYPTKNVTLVVENACSPELEIVVTEVGQKGFSDTSDAANAPRWSRVHDGILLQNNGWVLYWNDPALRPSKIPGGRHPQTAATTAAAAGNPAS